MENLVPSSASGQDTGHSLHSSLRESMLEHLFLGELLRHLWQAGERRVHVLRAEVDAGGYDLVVECNGYLRFIQLKSSRHDAKTAKVDVNTAIQGQSRRLCDLAATRPGNALSRFLWFGGPPGTRMPHLGDRIARHTRRNRNLERNARPAIRVVPKRSFEKVVGVEALVGKLFGPIR
jgi:hypothetical protein